jgi:Fur family peroxide stress response transcriptional regulator
VVTKIERNTVQRQIVLRTINNLIHPFMDEIYDEIHIEHPSISKATVSRNLRLLADNKIIAQVFMPDGLERYDRRTESHYHFKCQKCGGIFDIDTGYLAKIDLAVEEKYGFKVEKHDIVFMGICLGCKDREQSKN